MANIFEGAEKKKRPATVTILKNVEEVTSFLLHLGNFPRFMKGIESVEDMGDGRWRWKRLESGRTSSWETVAIETGLSSSIAWKTPEGTPLPQASAISINQAQGGRGTIVCFKSAFLSPTGRLAAAAEKLRRQDPHTEAAVDLRRLKALLESGEIPTIEGQPDGRKIQRAA